MLIGIDGGGSKNDLILFTADGKTLNRVIGKGSNVSEMGPEAASARLIGQIAELLKDHGGMEAEIQAIFAGLSGGGAISSRQFVIDKIKEALPNAREVHISGDTVTALYAGVGTGDGMAVIAGTGTSEFVRYGGGQTTMVGGWGHLIDDSGSGFWLGKEAINAALREADGRGKKTLLTQLVEEKLGKSVRSSISYLYSDGKRTIASFAPVVFAAAEQGDEVALDIIRRGADELALLITTGDYSKGYLIREYSQLDPNATVKFRITYSWYDSNSDRFFDPDDRYVINGREVTKAEYDRAKEQYGDRSTGKIQWYYLTRQTMQSIPLG